MPKSSTRSSSVCSQNSATERSGSTGSDPQYKRIKFDSDSMDTDSSPIPIETSVADMNTVSSGHIKTQAAFVNKLYKMLEDPDTLDLISWSSQGDLFSVSNPTAFSKTVLPQYFKHNNWQSFVRQLNMYGFHKVNDLIHSNLTNESQTWEFKHPNFRRGAVNDLQHIKRRSAKLQQTQLQQQKQSPSQPPKETPLPPSEPTQPPNSPTVEHIPTQSKEDEPMDESNRTIIKHILRIEDHMLTVNQSCEMLYNEVVNLRMIVSKQQDAMQDLVNVVSTPKSNCDCGASNYQAMNQGLQNAENLRIQVSKLKGSRSSRHSNDNYCIHTDNNTNNHHHWKSNLHSPFPANRYSSSYYNTPKDSSFSKDEQQRTLPSLTTMQPVQPNYRMDKLSSISGYSSNGSNETVSEENIYYKDRDNHFEMKESNSSSTSLSPQSSASNEDNEKARSSMMNLGKKSYLLNPLKYDGKRKYRRKAGNHSY